MRAARCVRATAHVFGISVTRRLLEGARECQSAEQRGSQTSGVMRNTPTPVWELELDCRGNHSALRTSHSIFPRLSLQVSFLGTQSGAVLVQISLVWPANSYSHSSSCITLAWSCQVGWNQSINSKTKVSNCALWTVWIFFLECSYVFNWTQIFSQSSFHKNGLWVSNLKCPHFWFAE